MITVDTQLCALSWIRVDSVLVGTDLDAVTHVSYAFNVNGEQFDKEIGRLASITPV